MFLDARRVLFEGLVDYAGLFPPASLAMDDAIAGYRNARSSPEAWIAGRFICPASRLAELAASLIPTMENGEAPWPLAVILDGDVASAAATTQVFAAEMGSAVQIVFTEVPLPSEFALTSGRPDIVPYIDAACSISPTVVPFFEIPRTESWQTTLDIVVPAIANETTDRHRTLGAKLRTGGATAAAFPSLGEVADFVIACATHGVPFKATAGLHHPYRHKWADLGVERHGFINLLAAAALADHGATRETIVAALSRSQDHQFHIGVAGMTVGDTTFDIPALQRIRTALFPSYGSCSFEEPTEDLRSLGLLPRPLVLLPKERP